MNKKTIIEMLRNIRRKYKEKVKKYKVKGSYAIQIDETDDRAIKEAITIIQTKDIDRIKAINERILELQELIEGKK